jgi:hypothetical protein
MVRIYVKTTVRGYGRQHQLLHAALPAAWQTGDKCAICGRAMWNRWLLDAKTGRRVSAMDLAHDYEHPGAYLGLSHRSCNRAEANIRRQQAKGWLQPRRW